VDAKTLPFFSKALFHIFLL